MAALTWRENPPVKESLEQRAYEFDFYQAVSLLEQAALNTDAKIVVPLGEGNNPTLEAVRIKSYVSLSVPISEVHSAQVEDGKNPAFWINFLSIAGIQGPLPTPYTESVIQRTRQKDTAFRDFLDIFNHRFASLWYRLRRVINPTLMNKTSDNTAMGKAILSLCGMQQAGVLKAGGLEQDTLLSYHDLLWKRSHSAAGLVQLIQSFFKVPVSLTQFRGQWREVNPSEVSTLGRRGKFNALGKTTILGQKCWDQGAGVTLTMGPLSWGRFCDFLPLKTALAAIDPTPFDRLKDLSFLYAGLGIGISVCLVLNRFDAKPVRLNRGFALGYNTWLAASKVSERDLVVRINLT
ncbi:MAG: type VI secretion system baseplate subunit TssG [Alphaproteobacteria bacterium]|nr:type VI secretion system baseplate subunit TssG [Alphaproteobacteria bacterium]